MAKVFIVIVLFILLFLTAVLGAFIIGDKRIENWKEDFLKKFKEILERHGDYYNYTLFVAKKYLKILAVLLVLCILALIF